MRFRSETVIILVSTCVSFLICWFSKDLIFFWDTIQLASKHAHWFLENGLSTLALPAEMDSGNPPFFGFYLASIWYVFGKSLATSHLAMWPFLVIVFYFAVKIAQNVTTNNQSGLILLLLFANPGFLGHCVLVSPDIALVGFTLMAIWSLLKNKYQILCVSIIGMALISLRGTMMIGVLLIWSIYFQENSGNRYKAIKYFLPGILLSAGFLCWHFTTQSWIVYHDASPWMESFQKARLSLLARNLGIYAWRLVDYNFIFLYLGIFCLWYKSKSLIRKELIALWFIMFFIFLLVTVPFTGLLNHRYFLLFSVLASFVFLAQLNWGLKLHRLVYFVVIVFLFSGNLWIYPKSISQGWDSTAAHWPYYSLEKQMRNEIEAIGLTKDQIGTHFPLKSAARYLYLDNEIISYKEVEINTDQYILWSNIINDFTDDEILRFETEWEELISLSKGGIQMILYQKR